MFILMLPVAGQPSSSPGSVLSLLRVWLSSNFLPSRWTSINLLFEERLLLGSYWDNPNNPRCQEAPIEVEVPMWFSCSLLFWDFFVCVFLSVGGVADQFGSHQWHLYLLQMIKLWLLYLWKKPVCALCSSTHFLEILTHALLPHGLVPWHFFSFFFWENANTTF